MLSGQIWFSGDFSVGTVVSDKDKKSNKNDFVRVTGIRQAHKRGSKGLTTYGKRMVRSSAKWLEQTYSKETLTFGTCTLPELEDVDLQKICTNWGEISRKFFQELTRLLRRLLLPENYIQVVEIQEKRYSRTGKPYPHLHWICKGRLSRYDAWKLQPKVIRELWNRILSNELNREISSTASTRIERIRKSAAAYLSKYMSKGGAMIAQIASENKFELPTAWYGLNQSLKQTIKGYIQRLDNDNAEVFSSALETLQELGLLWFKPVTVEVTDYQTGYTREIDIGFYGRITNQDLLNQYLSLN